MNDFVQRGDQATPVLFPYQPLRFLEQIRQIVKEELDKQLAIPQNPAAILHTPGLEYKPLLKITEVCALFQVSKPTIYDWVKHGKLKPFKVRSRVYFLWQDIRQLIDSPRQQVSN